MQARVLQRVREAVLSGFASTTISCRIEQERRCVLAPFEGTYRGNRTDRGKLGRKRDVAVDQRRLSLTALSHAHTCMTLGSLSH